MTDSTSPYLSRSSSVLFAVLFGWFCIAPTKALAQVGPAGPAMGSQTGLRANDVTQNNNCDYRSLELKVYSDPKAKIKLDREAVARLYDKSRKMENWRTSTDESEIVFCLDIGEYDLDVSAMGYLTQHKDVRVDGTLYNIKMQIIMEKDPEAVDLNASDADLPPNVRKDVKAASSLLKNSKFKEAQKRLERAYQAAPSSRQINFLLGYLYLQQKDYEKAETSFTRAVAADPREVQALTLLGRVQLQREHYEDARKTLEKAVDANTGYWMAHNLLADACLQTKQYERARQEAQLAIDQGKQAGSVAQLVLGQALVFLGKTKEGLEALSAFIQTNPGNPAVPGAKTFIANINKQSSDQAAAHVAAVDLALAASTPSLPPSAWGPPGVDDIKPPVVAGVSCPYDQVVEMSGERVKQLVDSIAQFAATEDMLHEQLDPTGKPITKETRKFDYVASISEAQPGFLATDEYRNTKYGLDDLPDRIVTTGFVSLALIFHPDMRENYKITCEGLGDWHGHATWIMRFQQREDRPSRLADLVVGGESYPINLKGRAWITADTFQIVRMESELMNRVPLLAVQHQIAEYGPVHFQKKNIDLWLPQSVDLFFELNRHRYYRRHSFDHYMLFAVNADEKQQMPKGSPETENLKQNR